MPRINSSLALENEILYIFGGTNCDKKFDDLWSFDLKNLKWTHLNPTGTNPDSRYGHSIINYKGKLIIFGGIHNVTHEKNDMILYNI